MTPEPTDARASAAPRVTSAPTATEVTRSPSPMPNDPSFRSRWLIERRTELIAGISSVATCDTSGFEAPDWTVVVGESPPTRYVGLPGQWSGIPCDCGTGEGDSRNPGLPADAGGCLSST